MISALWSGRRGHFVVWSLCAAMTLVASSASAKKKKKKADDQAVAPTAQTAPAPAPPAAPPPAPPPPPSPPTPPKPVRHKVMVLDLQLQGVDPKDVPPLSDVVAWEITRHPGYDVVSSDDVRRMSAFQADKQTLGCADEACMVEISRKLDAELIVHGSIGAVGHQFVLNLSLIDTTRVGHAAGALETVSRLSDIPKVVPACLAKLFQWNATATVTAFRLPKGKKQAFAVFDLKPTGLSPETAQNLTQVLSVEVKGIEGASVISKEDISAMLQLSATKVAAGCSDDGCMAEIGGALGVDWLITGDAGKLGAMFIVNLRLIDVRRGAVENRVTESYQGDEEQLLRAVRHAGRTLLGIPESGAGRLAVTANLNAANVFVDDTKRGDAPLPIDSLPVGRHTVRVSHDGYFDWHGDIYVDPAETTSVWAQLAARPQAWYQKWWVWTIAGVVVAGATTASIVATRPAPNIGHGTVTFP